MYSAILAAALATSGSEVGCHFRCGYACCPPAYSCCGCYGYGCYGACYGCGGCYGGCYGACYGCGGCYGCIGMGCYGYYGAVYPTYAPSAGAVLNVPPVMPSPAEVAPVPKKVEAKETSMAKLVIEVPADAKLYIDDQLMKGQGVRRKFYTPKLEPGQKYYYEIRVDVVRNGETVSETKKVTLQGGDLVAAAIDPSQPRSDGTAIVRTSLKK